MTKLNVTERVTTAVVVLVVLIVSSLLLTSWTALAADDPANGGTTPPNGNGSPSPPQPVETAQVTIGGTRYTFDPTAVASVRPDIFQPGHFSLFDVLVHLGERGTIDLDYHFDASLNTHVIDVIDGVDDWWYRVYYDGGWSEDNVFRMDHYPWKHGTALRVVSANPAHLETIYATYREEVTRRAALGRLVVPRVSIRGRSFQAEFENVAVTPHAFRNDVFASNITTALDVIASLQDQGALTYPLQWYESIGTADIVKSYWVEAINDDVASGRCGFVYESGAHRFSGFTGNHIHLPADTRVLNAPEYVEFFWICI